MYIVPLSVFILQISFTNCIQLEYKLIPDHCEVTNVNESLVHFIYKKCIKKSRTELYLNETFTYKVDTLSDNMGQIKIAGYQFRSNEYRKGPIEFMMGMCSGLATNLYDVPNMLSNSNVRCPLIKIKITGYQFRSNEYRKGPIEFMMGMCSGLSTNRYDVPNMLSNSNFRCPLIKPRTYYVYNLSPNATNMPPLIPEGKWMFEL